MTFRLGTILSFFAATSVFPLQLVNDSNYNLQATIYAADGTTLGTVLVKKQSSLNWNNSLRSGPSPYSSQTPYTIEWSCTGSEAAHYSTNEPAGPGSTVISSQGTGPKTCPLKKKENSDNSSLKPTESPPKRNIGPPKGLLQ